MSNLIRSLFFDRELVDTIKKSKPQQEILYNNLITGKITLQEYLAVTSK
jgi:hypothetical protein